MVEHWELGSGCLVSENQWRITFILCFFICGGSLFQPKPKPQRTLNSNLIGVSPVVFSKCCCCHSLKFPVTIKKKLFFFFWYQCWILRVNIFSWMILLCPWLLKFVLIIFSLLCTHTHRYIQLKFWREFLEKSSIEFVEDYKIRIMMESTAAKFLNLSFSQDIKWKT